MTPTISPTGGQSLPQRVAEDWPPVRWRNVGVLAAVSGGRDSVGLLCVLAELKLAAGGVGRLAAAHFHHGVRGGLADADEQFVSALCRSLNVELIVGRRQTQGDADEAALRRDRYRFLLEAAGGAGCRYVATGHTADDQAETILHRAVRGAGLRGLVGIPRVRRLAPGISIVRPLLNVRRSLLSDYLVSRGQPWRDDESNDDSRYTRNYLRKEILPRLQAVVNREAVTALCRLGQLAGEAQAVIDELAVELHDRAVIYESPQAVRLDLRQLSGQREFLVRELIGLVWRNQRWPRQALSEAHLRRVAELLLGSETAAAMTLPGAVRLARQGNQAWLRRLE